MKTPLWMLKEAVKVFQSFGCEYCLIGGHAATLYRNQERVTCDVDFAQIAEPLTDSRKLAEKIIKTIGLEPVARFIEQGHGSASEA